MWTNMAKPKVVYKRPRSSNIDLFCIALLLITIAGLWYWEMPTLYIMQYNHSPMLTGTVAIMFVLSLVIIGVVVSLNVYLQKFR